MKPKRKVNWAELMALGFILFLFVLVGLCPRRLGGGQSTVALIASGSGWDKCHLTWLLDVLSAHLTTFQSLLVNESPRTFRRCLVKVPGLERNLAQFLIPGPAMPRLHSASG